MGKESMGAASRCPGVINHHPAGARMQSWQSVSEKPGYMHPGKERNGSGGSPQPPLCKGGTAWQGHAGGIVKPGNSNRLSFNCPARQRSMVVRSPDRQHNMPAAARRQSLSRRSPTAPFAQGRLLCLSEYNRLSFNCPARQRSMGAASRCL